MMIDDEGANQEGVELANACTVMMLMFQIPRETQKEDTQKCTNEWMNLQTI